MRVFAAVVAMSLLLWGCGKSEKANADSDDAKQSSNPKKADSDDSGPGVTLDKAAQQRAGLKTQTLAEYTSGPELTAFGTLEEDPATSFVIRAPLAGTLANSPGHSWPSLGVHVNAETEIGTVAPRLLPTDRINISTQLATAKADLDSSVASVAAAKAAYDRAQALNSDNKNVSDRALQDAAARLAAEQAKERAARSNVQVLQASLGTGMSGSDRPLTAGPGGDVAEVLAQPGETVEQGAPILRLTNFNRLLARIDLPVGDHVSANSQKATIVPAGFEGEAELRAERVSVAPVTDPHTQGISLLYRLDKTLFGLRPGTAVTARLRLPGPSTKGVVIPRDALVQQNGDFWAYVQESDTRFSRRQVPQTEPVPGGFAAVEGFSPGARVVVVGAQSLLSEEFKSQNDTDQ